MTRHCLGIVDIVLGVPLPTNRFLQEKKTLNQISFLFTVYAEEQNKQISNKKKNRKKKTKTSQNRFHSALTAQQNIPCQSSSINIKLLTLVFIAITLLFICLFDRLLLLLLVAFLLFYRYNQMKTESEAQE